MWRAASPSSSAGVWPGRCATGRGGNGFRARLVPVGTERRFEALVAGEIDILCGATTATLSRRETVSFSLPIFHTGVGAILRRDAAPALTAALVEQSPDALAPAALAAALEGRRLGVRRATTAEPWLERFAEAAPDTVIRPFDRHDAAIEQLRAGEIDAYFADLAILAGLVEADEPLLASRRPFTTEPYALALPRGDEDLRLLVDRALSRLYRSGEVLELIERHFGRPGRDVRAFYRMSALPE
mgnify:FL=1